jgi:hypothetical protein
VPKYDIFSGRDHQDALWVEAVDGLGDACDRMKELAAKSPGAYFVFSADAGRVLASVDTSRGEDKKQSAAG